MDVLTSRLERGTKALQFDVCCEAIDQNFDCGCVLNKRLRKFALISESTIQEIWNYCLKEQP